MLPSTSTVIFSAMVAVSVFKSSFGMHLRLIKQSVRTQIRRNASQRGLETSSAVSMQEAFLNNVAKASPPKRLNALLECVRLNGEELVDPSQRDGLNPFLVPLSRSQRDGSLLCYIRWPTQREDMALQLVRTTESGVRLVSLNTDHLCHRLAAELDFQQADHAARAITAVNTDGHLYNAGDVHPFINSGKFPAETEHDKKLAMDRYLLTKVGSFPDCFERLARNFMAKGNDVSALVACERSVSVFYSWGHPLRFHAELLSEMGESRARECAEAAKSCMGLPKWTLASNQAVRGEEKKRR